MRSGLASDRRLRKAIHPLRGDVSRYRWQVPEPDPVPRRDSFGDVR